VAADKRTFANADQAMYAATQMERDNPGKHYAVALVSFPLEVI
jgi:hypothetical protein